MYRHLVCDYCIQPVQTIYIKAVISQTYSVIMAEAAALAVAAVAANQLSYNESPFYLIAANWCISSMVKTTAILQIGGWRSSHYNCMLNHQARVYNISRSLNSTADAFTRLALLLPVTSEESIEYACSYSGHELQCPLQSALNTVFLHSCRILAVSRC